MRILNITLKCVDEIHPVHFCGSDFKEWVFDCWVPNGLKCRDVGTKHLRNWKIHGFLLTKSGSREVTDFSTNEFCVVGGGFKYCLE